MFAGAASPQAEAPQITRRSNHETHNHSSHSRVGNQPWNQQPRFGARWRNSGNSSIRFRSRESNPAPGVISHLVGFKNSERKTSLFTQGIRNEGAKDGKSMLVFDNVNGQYFLRNIYSVYARTSVAFPKSKLEQKSQEAPAIRNIYAENSSR
jgi:hypothetical protein